MSARFKPIASFTTKRRTPVQIEIDGVSYSFAMPEEFGPSKQIRAARLGVRMRELSVIPTDEMTLDQVEEIERAQELLLAMVLPNVPKDVLRSLSDAQKTQLVELFNRFVSEAREASAPPTPVPDENGLEGMTDEALIELLPDP